MIRLITVEQEPILYIMVNSVLQKNLQIRMMYMRLIQPFKTKVTHVFDRLYEYNRMRNDYGATDSSSGLRAL